MLHIQNDKLLHFALTVSVPLKHRFSNSHIKLDETKKCHQMHDEGQTLGQLSTSLANSENAGYANGVAIAMESCESDSLGKLQRKSK